MSNKLFLTAVFLSLGVTMPSVCQPQNVGQAVGRLPGAVLWNLKIFHLFPKNIEEFNKAVDAEREKLGAGEKKTFGLVFTIAGGKPLLFRGLVPANEDQLLPGNERVVAEIEISKPRFVLATPLPAFDKDAWEETIGKTHPQVTWEDHKTAVGVWNVQSGFPEQGLPTKPIDLLDKTVRSGAAGTVILVAKADEAKYSVHNVATGKTEEYAKGAALKKSGNTVYVLMKSPQGREYTMAYRVLALPPMVSPGDAVKAGQSLGQFPEKDAAPAELWRVSGPAEYFLQGGAYRVAPLGNSP